MLDDVSLWSRTHTQIMWNCGCVEWNVPAAKDSTGWPTLFSDMSFSRSIEFSRFVCSHWFTGGFCVTKPMFDKCSNLCVFLAPDPSKFNMFFLEPHTHTHHCSFPIQCDELVVNHLWLLYDKLNRFIMRYETAHLMKWDISFFMYPRCTIVSAKMHNEGEIKSQNMANCIDWRENFQALK